MPTVRPNQYPIGRRAALLAVAALLALPAAAVADDATLLRELRAGAAVLMRHTQTTPGVGDPPGWRLDDCKSQRNLDASGIAHAKRIGQWFAANQLRVTSVRNSPWCRTRDTAMLAFGRHDDWPALSNLFEDRSNADAQAAAVKRYVESLRSGELVVLVSHGSAIGHIVSGQGLAPGEAVIVRGGAGAGAPLLVLGRWSVP
ncbi:MAG TPA: histidine phosphatase family protein [Burkholderiaceae bacterium]|nr:histidine phosphatase family protein [Burkholderiaceae bacterium]